MHTIHHTKAVILKSVSSGEANKRVWLFTEEFGLVVAIMQGVRKHGAKLQSQVIDYSIISADLVKGKDVWRLVSATVLYNPVLGKSRSPLARPYVRVLSAIERFLAGEGEQNHKLWNHIEACAFSIEGNSCDAKSFDALAIWKTLAHLGYISDTGENSSLIQTPFATALQSINISLTKKMIKEVNDAITETHL